MPIDMRSQASTFNLHLTTHAMNAPTTAPEPSRTFNRLKLRRLIEAGKITAVNSYRFDDQYGAERGLDREMAVRFMPEDRSKAREGTVHVYEDYFSGYGRATTAGTDKLGRQLVVLYVHSNLNFTFAINDRRVISTDELDEALRHTVPAFQKAMADIASLTRTGILDVFAWWRKYSDSDQSAILDEFITGYHSRLDPKGLTTLDDLKAVAAEFYATLN